MLLFGAAKSKIIMNGGAATTGAMSKIIFDQAAMDWAGWVAFLSICFIALIFGSMARIGMIDGDDLEVKTEKKRAVMLFGCLYIIALAIAEAANANIIWAALIAAATGAAGPLAVKWLVNKFFG